MHPLFFISTCLQAEPFSMAKLPKIRLVLALFFFMVLAQYSSAAQKATSFQMGRFEERGGLHSGIELSLLFQDSSYFAQRGSALLYTGLDAQDNSALYGGYSYTVYVHANTPILNPYLGLGMFAGKTFYCSEKREERGECEDYTTIALYPEIGLALTLGPLQLYTFSRFYYDTHADLSKEPTYGVHIGIVY